MPNLVRSGDSLKVAFKVIKPFTKANDQDSVGYSTLIMFKWFDQLILCALSNLVSIQKGATSEWIPDWIRHRL